MRQGGRRLTFAIGALLVVTVLGFRGGRASALEHRVGARSNDDLGIQAYQFLKTGTSAIRDLTNGSVAVSGSTEAYVAVDFISVTLVLQEQTPSGWKEISRWRWTKSGASSVSGSTTHPVTRGRTYRVVGLHEAQEGSVYEWATTETAPITVQ